MFIQIKVRWTNIDFTIYIFFGSHLVISAETYLGGGSASCVPLPRPCTSQIPPLEGSLEARTVKTNLWPLRLLSFLSTPLCSSGFLFFSSSLGPIYWSPSLCFSFPVLTLTFLSLIASLFPLFFLFCVPLSLLFHLSLPSIFLPCLSSLLLL